MMFVFNVFKSSGRCDSAECDGAVLHAVFNNEGDAIAFIDDYKDIVSIHPEFDFFIEKQEIGKVRSFDQVW